MYTLHSLPNRKKLFYDFGFPQLLISWTGSDVVHKSNEILKKELKFLFFCQIIGDFEKSNEIKPFAVHLK